MSISYFEGKKWKEITREERYFCSELFGCIKENEKTFVKFLKSKPDKKLEINENSEWDSGYEVCFYRDLLKMRKKKIKGSGYPQKRTFDLALFSNECIIIIEAKAQQGFVEKQLTDIKNDIKKIKKIIGKNIEVKLVSLVSSDYKPKEKTKKYFDCNITWEQMAEEYKTKTEIFKTANTCYNN